MEKNFYPTMFLPYIKFPFFEAGSDKYPTPFVNPFHFLKQVLFSQINVPKIYPVKLSSGYHGNLVCNN
jgi:hypothetical protein